MRVPSYRSPWKPLTIELKLLDYVSKVLEMPRYWKSICFSVWTEFLSAWWWNKNGRIHCMRRGWMVTVWVVLGGRSFSSAFLFWDEILIETRTHTHHCRHLRDSSRCLYAVSPLSLHHQPPASSLHLSRLIELVSIENETIKRTFIWMN